MPVIIPDEMLEQTRLTDPEMRIEIACRLYDAGKLDMHPAAQFAGLDRMGFEEALIARRLPVYRYTEQDYEQDMAAVEKMQRLDREHRCSS